MSFIICDATASDIEQIHYIYSYYVLHTNCSFEEEVPSLLELEGRMRMVKELYLPYLVAKQGDRVVGYAYVAPYRTRSAYRFTIEDSVYVDGNCTGMGIGTSLLTELITRAGELDYSQVIAVIGGRSNISSIKLHEKLGFVESGVLKSVGFKFGEWVDNVLMQLSLKQV